MKEQEKKKTISMQVEEMVGKFCDDFCKYPDKMQALESAGKDDESNQLFEEVCCKQCPFNLF